MDFLDKVVDAAKSVGQTVAKTTGDLYDKGKIKVNLVQAQSDLRDIYREYGEYIYKAEKSGNVDAAAKADFIAKADAIVKRIEDLQASEEQAKEDASKEAAVNAASQDDQKCAACGAVRENGAAFCGGCGAQF